MRAPGPPASLATVLAEADTGSSAGPSGASEAGRGERRRLELLEATLRVIGSEGIRAVTHRRVAAESGTPLGAITYYFSTKEDLIAACLHHVAAAEVSELEDRVAGMDVEAMDSDAWADELLRWLGSELAGPARDRLVARYVLQLEAVRRPELRRIYDAWTVASFRLARRMLAAAGARDPDMDAAVLLAAVDGLRLNQLSSAGAHGDLEPVRPVAAHIMRRLLG